jgi:hypothetical protein
LTVEVDAADSAVGMLVTAILQHTELRDLIVDDPPLDDVIRNLYATADEESDHAFAEEGLP